MRLLTYFAFTLLSVVIQFCVMDFIQGKIEPDDNTIYLNETLNNMPDSVGILKAYRDDAYALYYRVNGNKVTRDVHGSKHKSNNSSLYNISALTATELPFTVFDVLYENDTITDGAFTTENFVTSTELDNVTEITLFETTSSTVTPNTFTKKARNRPCYCNLLYQQCDINCCCDDHCSLADMDLFGKCKTNNLDQNKYRWSQQLACGDNSKGGLGNLFCIAKTNLPDKRAVVKRKINEEVMNDVYSWHDNNKKVNTYNFNRRFYMSSDPVWILRNKSIYYLDLPASITNNYCSIRRQMNFLRNENINCQIKLKDLEMFHILKTVKESTVISEANHSTNNTVLNCSSLYCTNWTIIYCDQEENCLPYNKSLHEPTCTESWCTNIALKLEYIFYIYDSKIVNATVKLYTQRISTSMQYLTQEIIVNFYIGIASLERVITLSGNPGYIEGLPIIASFSQSNHTDNFYNGSNENHYLSYPNNIDGQCVLSKFTKRYVQFGFNKRNKCKISLRPASTFNGTQTCIDIQHNINKVLCIDSKVYISPYGNPDDIKDDHWLPIGLEKRFIYGVFYSKTSKLQCFNLQTRVSFSFTYADFSDTAEKEENMLLSARVDGFATNVTFSTEEYRTVITVDIKFINVNKLTQYELAGPPHLDLNLPKNFFFPFPSNECHSHKRNMFLIIFFMYISIFH